MIDVVARLDHSSEFRLLRAPRRLLEVRRSLGSPRDGLNGFQISQIGLVKGLLCLGTAVWIGNKHFKGGGADEKVYI